MFGKVPAKLIISFSQEELMVTVNGPAIRLSQVQIQWRNRKIKLKNITGFHKVCAMDHINNRQNDGVVPAQKNAKNIVRKIHNVKRTCMGCSIQEIPIKAYVKLITSFLQMVQMATNNGLAIMYYQLNFTEYLIFNKDFAKGTLRISKKNYMGRVPINVMKAVSMIHNAKRICMVLIKFAKFTMWNC